MVVMGRVKNAVPWSESSHSPLSRNLISSQLQQAVTLLHSNNLVHGDLRDVNVLIEQDGQETAQSRLFLIDFDWCGVGGVHRYPHFMNHVQIVWPQGAGDNQIMETRHDTEMMRRLLDVGSGSSTL